MCVFVLALPGLAHAQQPTLSGTELIGSFTTTNFRCFTPVFNYQASGNVAPSTSPYSPGTFTQSGHVGAAFVANFVIQTASGTTIEGTARGPITGGCGRGGGTNVFTPTPNGNLSANYEATITTADGGRFSDAGAAFASFVGQAPQEQNLAGQSRLSFVSQFANAQPIRGAHLNLVKGADTTQGSTGAPVSYTYTLVNNGSETLFHVSVQDDGCEPVTYHSGDANNDALLQPGERWTFTCSRSYSLAGSYTGEAIGGGTSTQTGLPVRSNPSRTTVVVRRPFNQPDLELRKTADKTSGQSPLSVVFTYTLTNFGSETLFHVSVTDEGCSPVTYQSGDANSDQLLAPGEIWTFTCSRTYTTPGTYTEAATARGTSAQTGLPVSAESNRTTITVTRGPLDVVLSKSASPTSGAAPLNVEFTYTLANNGTQTLFHVSVTDEGCSPVTYQSGDANSDELLQPDETWTFACSRTYTTPGTYTEAATARATSSETGLPVRSESDRTTITVTGGASDIALTKSASRTSGAAPLNVEFTYTLANRGSETLFHVSVIDEGCSPVSYRSGDVNGDELLQPGETWTFMCSRTYTAAGTYTEAATARGTSTQTGLPVSSNASQTTIVVSAPPSGV